MAQISIVDVATGIGENVDSVVILAAIGGIVVILYVVNALIGKGMNAADRAVRHKTYESGLAEATAQLHIAVPVTPEHAVDVIVHKVNAYDKAPAVVAGLYLRDRTETEAIFAFGSKLQDAFVAAVELIPSPEGAVGHFEVLEWQESGADIYGRDEMSRLRGRVAEAVRDVGGTVVEDALADTRAFDKKQAAAEPDTLLTEGFVTDAPTSHTDGAADESGLGESDDDQERAPSSGILLFVTAVVCLVLCAALAWLINNALPPSKQLW